MKLSTASAILCTALLASFCNAFPYLDYWDHEAFLEQLQQEERVGTDVEARIEQAGKCQRPRINKDFDLNNTNIKTILNLLNFSTGEVIGAEFNYECASNYTLFVSHDGGVSFQMSPKPKIPYKCTFEAESYQPSINANGIPRCVPLCPELQDIPNGTVNYTSRKPGATATYSCNSNYTREGTEIRTCGQNAPGQWSGQEPTCEPDDKTSGEPRTKCPELKESDIPNNVPEVRSKLWNHPNRKYLLFTPYYQRRIEGDRFEGSKAYLTCMHVSDNIIGDGWKLLEGTPSEQTCVRRNGELVWTRAGTCVYKYSYPRPWPSYG